MGPVERFKGKDTHFWAHVKFISEVAGYSARRGKDQPIQLKLYTANDIIHAFQGRGLSTQVIASNGGLTAYGQELLDYLNTRKHLLETYAEPNLQNGDQAKAMYESIVAKYSNHSITIVSNRQARKIKHPLYLQNTVNILTEAVLGDITAFQPDPSHLLTIADNNNRLQRVLCRRLDGACPSTHNPKAIWECKEYYGTTTFGSRVADGVYESMLVGHELAEMRDTLGIDVKHYLFIDDYFTWWNLGRSYLCRLVDAIHIGQLDEVIFGKEVLTAWPNIIASW